MKIENTSVRPAGLGATRRAQAAQAYGGSASEAVRDIQDTTELFGIPEAELTPKVRTALMALMAEVARLREEIAKSHGRIEHLEKLADQDSLLTVYNRRAFVRELTRVISIAERYGTPSSVLYFDVDGMKSINDRLGHSAGDAALQQIADSLQESVRDSDVIGRLGGDEFGVILFNTDAATSLIKGKALADAINLKPMQFNDAMLPLHVTYGSYTFTGKEDPATVLAAADQAMYERKRAPRK
jgi:diguanylate cyclase (GGDEF)-like protein